jgi:transposase-like protein
MSRDEQRHTRPAGKCHHCAMRNAVRGDTRAGHYKRNLKTKAGDVRLKIPQA